MKTSFKSALTMLLVLALIGCSVLRAPPTDTPVPPTDTPLPTDTPPPTDTATPFPTDTPTDTPTKTPPPTRTPLLTATQEQLNREATATQVVFEIQATATQVAQWPIVISSSFDKNGQGWWTGKDDDKFSKADVAIAEGVYQVDLTAKKAFYWTLMPDMRALTDFLVSVEAQQKSGSADDDFGLVFHHMDDENFYYFAIDNNKEFALLQVIKGEWTTLVDWKETPAIRPFEVNQLTVIGQDNHFELFINDQYMGHYANSELPKGKAGLLVDMYNADDHAVFVFDNFQVRAPGVTTIVTTPQPQATVPSTAPDFLVVVQNIKSELGNFGWIIDQATTQTGYVDCNDVVYRYTVIVGAPTWDVVPELANPYGLYRAAIDTFASGAKDMYQNCADFLVNPTGGSIPNQQWGPARQSVDNAMVLIKQAITLAGGTP